MFGSSKWVRFCKDKTAPGNLPSAIAKVTLFCSAGVIDDKSIWPGGNAKQTDAALFEASSCVFSYVYRLMVANDHADGIARLVGAANSTAQDVVARAKPAIKNAGHIMVTSYVAHTDVDEATARGLFGLGLERYIPSDRLVDDLMGVLRSMPCKPPQGDDLIRSVTRGFTASVTQSTIFQGALESVANCVRMDLSGAAPWQRR